MPRDQRQINSLSAETLWLLVPRSPWQWEVTHRACPDMAHAQGQGGFQQGKENEILVLLSTQRQSLHCTRSAQGFNSALTHPSPAQLIPGLIHSGARGAHRSSQSREGEFSGVHCLIYPSPLCLKLKYQLPGFPLCEIDVGWDRGH